MQASQHEIGMPNQRPAENGASNPKSMPKSSHCCLERPARPLWIFGSLACPVRRVLETWINGWVRWLECFARESHSCRSEQRLSLTLRLPILKQLQKRSKSLVTVPPSWTYMTTARLRHWSTRFRSPACHAHRARAKLKTP